MATKYYLNFFSESYNKSSIDKEAFYNNLKNDLLKNYKWQPSLFTKMVKENDVNFEHSIEILKWLNENYVVKQVKASKGFANFILILQNKLERGVSNKVIQISDRDLFLNDLEAIRSSHFDITTKTYLDFLDKNFDLGLTRGSLESYYYQKLH